MSFGSASLGEFGFGESQVVGGGGGGAAALAGNAADTASVE